jgi:hypothetical protein
MNKVAAIVLVIILSIQLLNAQSRFPVIDKSPMDMSYYPANYPILKIQDKTTEALVARVCYSRPQRNGRNVFGELLEYNKVWRMGANEATEIEFFKDVIIGNKLVPKGRYTIYAIPNPEKWSIMINRETDTWGAFKYDATRDIVKLDVPVEKLSDPLEAFSIVFETAPNAGFLLTAAWENVAVSLPIFPYQKKSSVKLPAKKLAKK